MKRFLVVTLALVACGDDGNKMTCAHPPGAFPEGDPIGQLTVPASVSLMAESRNTVWGVERDQDDLESIVRYKVGS
mgnify:CR=1 FL=1